MRRIVTVILLGAALPLYSPSISAGYSDGDSDKVEDEDDNCRGAANPLQFDIDGDGEVATRSMKVVGKQPGEAKRDNAYSVAG